MGSKVSKKTVSAELISRYSSATECFFQEFMDAVLLGDRIGAALASARIAQVGLSMFELFKAGADNLVLSTEENVKCHEAAIVVRNVLDKHLDKVHAMYTDQRTYGPN